jgi:hypothetical protein
VADEFVITFPVYALLLNDGSGVVALRHGTDIWLPLFTDNDAVQTYLERSEIGECLVRQLSTSAELADFLENPPSRVPGKPPGDCETVVIDPIDPAPRRVMLFNIPKLIQSLRR